MAKLDRMTLEALRSLAREALGAQAARLKTKKELVAALQAAGVSAGRPPAAEKRAAPRRGAAGRKKAAPSGAKAAARKGKAVAVEKVRDARAPGAAAEPGVDPEGYFVARVRGEEAARQAPHPMTEAAAEAHRPPVMRELGEARGWEEGPGDLPWSYADDVLVALPRDPRTLFLYWDYAHRTLAEAFAGLEGGRVQLWVFARDARGGLERVRTTDFALESRCFYVHDLEPGRTYLAEIHVVDRQGRERRLGRPSNEVPLPREGLSPLVDDRLARIPWDLALGRWLREVRRGGPFPEELRALLARLSDWSRFAGRAWGGSAGGMGGRPFSPSGAPSSPRSSSRPSGAGEGE